MKTHEQKAVGHTAGPWKASQCSKAHPDESEANARLISQAPAMLEALEIALSYMERDADDEQERADHATITAIIARAKGET